MNDDSHYMKYELMNINVTVVDRLHGINLKK